ncbi:hypothetical protein OH77DRAFT_1499102 [Trametes cingulata]|nr:hypothetical protein OH77DRAFT_1499102 [Trametes cingulata]
MASPLHSEELVAEFRHQYRLLEGTIRQAFTHGSDITMLERLQDRVVEYNRLVRECEDLRIEAHRGRPVVVKNESPIPSQPGRPRILIDRQFLQWAYTQRSISSIARFLGIHRHTVRRCLVDYGILTAPPAAADLANDSGSEPASPRSASPASESGNQDGAHEETSEESDDLLDPTAPLPLPLPVDAVPTVSHLQHTLSDEDLDHLLKILRSHYHRAGLSMLDGMLRELGYRVPRERVRASLLRIDPVRRVFERIRIRRREYKVAGPNALWHHDGQHGTSVHNIRIERLWVDVTTQVGAKWADFFGMLELHHGLDINNPLHIWLLHRLFLHELNQELSFFAGSWNQHKISMRNGPRRSPADMYGFDMLVHGMRGDPPDERLDLEELEVYGVDWEGLRDDTIRAMHSANNPSTEGWTSWIGQTGVPARELLSEVEVLEPDVMMGDRQTQVLAALDVLLAAVDDADVARSEGELVRRWNTGLAIATAYRMH